MKKGYLYCKWDHSDTQQFVVLYWIKGHECEVLALQLSMEAC